MPDKTNERRDWETATYAGLIFALRKYRTRLREQRHFVLNSKPREIDVRIIDQEYTGTDRMDNAIANFFEKHNLFELKDPYEALNIDIVWKGISYTAQYKSRGYDDVTRARGVDAVKMEDVTLTFLRVSKPDALFKYMRDKGYGITRAYPGVYRITGIADIKMQIVIASELEGDEFASLRIQKANASDIDVKKFVEMIEQLSDSSDKELADHIMQISISENRSLYDRLRKEEPEMCTALRELMDEDIRKELKDTRKETADLMAYLASNGRNDDIIKASSDEDFLNQLFAEFHSMKQTEG